MVRDAAGPFGRGGGGGGGGGGGVRGGGGGGGGGWNSWMRRMVVWFGLDGSVLQKCLRGKPERGIRFMK